MEILLPFSESESILWLKFLVLSHLAFKNGRCLNHYHVIGSSKVHTNDERRDSYSLDTSFVPSSATSALLTGWLLGEKPKNLNWSSARFLPIFSSYGMFTVRATHQVFLKACFKILLSRTVHCFFFFGWWTFCHFTEEDWLISVHPDQQTQNTLKVSSWSLYPGRRQKKKRASLLLTYLRCKFDPGTSSWLSLFHITFSASSLQGIYKRYERREHPVTFFHCQRCRKKTKWVFIVLPSCTVTIKVHILYHHQLLKTDQKWTLQNTNKEKHLNIAIQI